MVCGSLRFFADTIAETPTAMVRKQTNSCAAPDAASAPMADGGTADAGRDFREAMLSGDLTKESVRRWGERIAVKGLWEEALQIAHEAEPKAAFRAAWALEHAWELWPEGVVERFGRLLEILLASPNVSVQRIFSKIAYELLRQETVSLTDDEAEALVACCFDRLTDPATPSGVAVWQIRLLDLLSARIGWVGEQLDAIVRQMSEAPDCTPAIASCARRYLRRRRRAGMCW